MDRNEFLKVALVAPVHNRRETTLQALRSLSRIRTENFEVKIFIVDDGSVDGTDESITNNFPDVELIRGDGTLHYAAGTNRGIQRAMEWGADFVVTMNDDSVFHESFLQRLVATALAHPKSIVGALLLLWDEPHRVFQVGLEWKTLKGGWVTPDDLTAFSVSVEPFHVECIVGNCVLIPVAAIREVGLMDEKKFPHGWGDAQWTTRMRKAGWELLIDPKALVWCEPNTYPEPLHLLSAGRVFDILFRDERHPSNLKRQFVAKWYSAPSRLAATAGFIVDLARLLDKALKYGVEKRRRR